ncbi:MAG: response regulator [Opitutaceae bacterium]|jgi:two-component system chemotaxis response regulator CheY
MPRPSSALIVDDEPHVRVYLRMLLKQVGIATIWEASDGAKACELFIEHRPGVVLLDIVMPGKTGPGVMADLKAIDPSVPVIVVTSQVALKTVEEMHDLGAVCYILKHTPRDQMLKMLTDALDSIGEES